MASKILLVAPHPFYQERGTPIAVDILLRALSENQYHVDLVTFNEGTDVNYPGLTIHRVSPVPPIRNVKPGFSLKKIYLDVFVFFKLISLLRNCKYDVVHAVEESALMALVVCPLFRTPYIYDMDSSMTTQLLDKIGFLRPFESLLRFIESLPMRKAKVVVPVCQALADEVYKYRSSGVFVLKDVSLVNGLPEQEVSPINIRRRYQCYGKILMYIGNLESYQGIDLMLSAFQLHSQRHADSHLIVIGGEDDDIEKYRMIAIEMNLKKSTTFMGKQPINSINGYMSQADILVSPRIHGVNTPMKVYSYLDSGVPVLATNLPTHTQVADESVAYLADPEVKAFSRGMDKLVEDAGLRERLAENAKKLIQKEHSFDAFQARIKEIYQQVIVA